MFMNRFLQSSFFVLFIFPTVSCEEDLTTRNGFDSTFNSGSHGLTMLHVDNKSETVYLNGNVIVDNGTVQIVLHNQNNDTINNTKIEFLSNVQSINSFLLLPVYGN